MARLLHDFTGLDTAAKSREQQSLQPVLRLRPSCAGITFEGRVGFAMPQRWNTNGKKGSRKRTQSEAIQDFWEKVKKGRPDDCWPWIAGKNEHGYGTVSGGLAHRFCYTITKGVIPTGLCVLHKCDHPDCNNPEHLFLGTQADNIRDCVSKNRQRSARGEQNKKHLLTDKKVTELRRLMASGVKIDSIVKRFKVAESTAYQANRRRTWRHVP